MYDYLKQTTHQQTQPKNQQFKCLIFCTDFDKKALTDFYAIFSANISTIEADYIKTFGKKPYAVNLTEVSCISTSNMVTLNSVCLMKLEYLGLPMECSQLKYNK